MIFPFHGKKVPSKLHQFMVSEVRRWSPPAGKSCRGKTHHAGVLSAPSSPPKALPPPQLRGGCLVLLALLSPQVRGAQQAWNTGTPPHSDTGVHRGPQSCHQDVGQHPSGVLEDHSRWRLLAGRIWKTHQSPEPQALLPHSFRAELTGCPVSSTQSQH